MSDLNVIVLSPAEKPIVWLNSDTLNITYTEEWDKIPSISIEYLYQKITMTTQKFSNKEIKSM